MALDVKSLQGYSVNARVPQNSILGPSGFPRYVNDLSDMLPIVLLSMLKILLSTRSEIRHLIRGNN